MVTFLYGEESFRLNEKLNKIKEEFFYKNTSNASLGVFDFGEKCSVSDLKTSIKSRGLFANKTLIIVKNILISKDKELKKDFYNFLENNLVENIDESVEIVFYEESLPAKNDKIFKWLLKNIKSEEFKKFNEIQLRKWIKEKFQSFEISIDEKIVTKLLECCGDNLFLISNEIIKIANYLQGTEKNINKEEIAKLLNSKIEADIFRTIEFLSAGNKKMALETLHKQLDKGDDPFYILSMYVYQFRNLLKIADFYFKDISNNTEIARLAKMHPFVVQKGMQQLKGFNLGQLKDIYQKLEKIDSEAKTGKKDLGLNLDMLIAEI